MKLFHLKKFREALSALISVITALLLIALATYAWYNLSQNGLRVADLNLTAVTNIKVSANLYVNDSPTPLHGPFVFTDLVPEEFISFRLEIKNSLQDNKTISVNIVNILDITTNPPYFLTERLFLYDLYAKADGVPTELPNLTEGGFLSELLGTNDFIVMLSDTEIVSTETIDIYFKIKLDATAGNGYRSLSAQIGGINVDTLSS